MENLTIAHKEGLTVTELGLVVSKLSEEDRSVLLLIANAFKVRDEKEKLFLCNNGSGSSTRGR